MEIRTPRFDRRSVPERIAQAEKFQRMAEQFKSNPELSNGFKRLAEEAREQVRQPGG